MKKIIAIAVATVAGLSIAGVSGAVVVRHAEGNTWSVGKGDVQSLFGWNAKMTDDNFHNVTFTYEKRTVSDVQCEYTVAYDETYETWVGGEKNSKLVERTAKHFLAETYDDTAVRLMTRSLQYEVKRNKMTNVIGAVLSPGASSTEVDLTAACDEMPDLSTVELTTEFGGTISNVRLQGTVQATELSRTTTETIYAAPPVTARSTTSSAVLWTTATAE